MKKIVGIGSRALAMLSLISFCWACSAQDWVEPMKTLNKGFSGTKGQVALFGDSITNSMAFWKVVSWTNPDEFIPGDGSTGKDGLPKKPQNKRWRDIILGVEKRGPENGNQSGWKTGNLLPAMDAVISRDKPELAIIMIGTNDVAGNKLPAEYQKELEQIVQKCLDAKCIPILNTIPPRKSCDDAVAKVKQIVKDTAAKFKIPLVDYHAEMIRISGGAWEGTVMHSDGVHPSNNTGKSHILNEENMKQNGYALRTWVNFLMFREIYFKVLEPNGTI